MGLPIGLVCHVVFFLIVQVGDPSSGNNVTCGIQRLIELL